MEKPTMVRIRKLTANKLKGVGKKGQSYDVVINDLIKKNIQRNTPKTNFHKILKVVLKKYWIYCTNCNKMKALHVHHINENRKDNGLQNLVLLCRKCHTKQHYDLGFEQRTCKNCKKKFETKNKKKAFCSRKCQLEDFKINKTKKKKCLDCSNLILNNSNRCKTCHMKYMVKTRKYKTKGVGLNERM